MSEPGKIERAEFINQESEESSLLQSMTNTKSSQFQNHKAVIEENSQNPKESGQGWLSWQIWAVVLIFLSGGAGFLATTALLKLPGSPTCHKYLLFIASAQNRISCAQIAAQKGTVEGFLEAIELVEYLSQDNPLRQQINQNVEDWARQILALAEVEFNQGKLQSAISIARKIPETTTVRELVEEKIDRWKGIWLEAEQTYGEFEKSLKLANWNQAFRAAVELAYIDNKYWSTVKYEETIKKIQIAQEESAKLDSAFSALRRGGIKNIIDAIEQAQKIGSQSYAYHEAQNLITQGKEKILKYAERLTDEKRWEDLLDLIEKIPESLGLGDRLKDWGSLADAATSAESETVEGLESAIIEAGNIPNSSPLYEQAQNLVSRWTLEIDDLRHLEKAKQLAEVEDINNLTAAINEAQLIPVNNPLYEQSQREIRRWKRKIQVTEDRPLLEKAKMVADNGTIEAWQEAITQVSLISSDRPLYQEARELSRKWRTQIETTEDQPFLDQAIVLANSSNYEQAITAASQIRQSRALYAEAQRNIRSWRREVRARTALQQAYDVAQGQTPESLAKAINIAKDIPYSTEVGSEASQSANRWAEQVLAIARETSNNSLERAIEIARLIPRGTEAYSRARSQIKIWQEMLQPPEIIPQSPSLTETNYSSP
jgi:hypothetical protein